ncbi:hypothetical protein HDU97_006670 [Phlyctochytrium planicorne]|nr:hypothetical protein HDU97_006670 [Phlyctochytrium planicorne]
MTEIDLTLYENLHFSHLYAPARQAGLDEGKAKLLLERLDSAFTRGTSDIPGFKVFSVKKNADEDELPNEYQESQRGKPCGHVFEKGEGVYYCKDCAVDPTCVMCYRCFHGSEHEGHETEFRVSSGHGGCCDCGDSEAWKVQPECDYHSSSKQPKRNMDEEGEEDENENELPSEYQEGQRGMPCGHVFEQGEGIYYCKNCALDPTCVMCYRCFHASDHEGHDTEFSISSGNGGCCDCGDVEAWKKVPECDYHSWSKKADDIMQVDDVQRIPIPEVVKVMMRKTVATILEFIVDTLSAFSMPSNINLREESIISLNPPDQVPRPSELQDIERDEVHYAILLWNDEFHNFEEVIDQVCRATRKTRDEAADVADEVDSIGRAVVYTSSSMPRVVSVASIVSSAQRMRTGGLTVSVRTIPDVYREDVASQCLDWLRALWKRTVGSQTIGSDTYESVADTVRTIVCEELCRKRVCVRERLANRCYDVASFLKTDIDDEKPRVDYLIGFEANFWKSVRVTLKELYISTLIVAGDEFKKTLGTYFANLLCDSLTKKSLALRFSASYLLLAHAYLLKDREADLSVINLSVQLYTVPTIASYIVEHTSSLSTMFLVLKTIFMSDPYPEHCNRSSFFKAFQVSKANTLAHYPKLQFREVSNAQYYHVISDIGYLLGTNQVASRLFRREDLAAFDTFLDFGCLLQGMNPHVRETRGHIDYESTGWIYAFPLSVNICSLVDHIIYTFAPTSIENVKSDFSKLVHAVRKVYGKLDRWCVYEQQLEAEAFSKKLRQEDPEKKGINTWKFVNYLPVEQHKMVHFDVSSMSVSFHYPLHWILAALLSLVPNYVRVMSSIDPSWRFDAMELFELNSESGIAQTPDFKLNIPKDSDITEGDIIPELPGPPEADGVFSSVPKEDRISRIFDYPLRVQTLLAQIQANLWVRNGQSMSDQAHTYSNHLVRSLSDHYLFLNQTACSLLGPDRFLTSMMDKFGLLDWFSGKSHSFSYTYTVVEPEKLRVVVEDFMVTLVYTLTERAKCQALSLSEQIRREVIHVLATNANGMQFSKIVELVPERLISSRPLQADAGYRDGVAVEFEKDTDSIEQIVKNLTTFKFPDRASDIGLYELREELLVEVDPWFYHYNPTQRAAVEPILMKFADKILGNIPKDYILKALVSGEETMLLKKVFQYRARPPRVQWIGDWSLFSPLNVAFFTNTFAKMMFFSLYNLSKVTNAVISDKIMSATVHLLLYAVETEALMHGKCSSEEMFTFKAVNDSMSAEEDRGHFVSTILDLVLGLLKRFEEDHVKEYVDRLAYFVYRALEFGGPIAAVKVNEWRESHALRTKDDADSGEVKSKKKADAKKRQQALMAQFQKQQQVFMSNFADDEDFIQEKISKKEDLEDAVIESALETIPNERVKDLEAGNCIVCQEEMVFGGAQDYGYLSFMQSCQMERTRILNFCDPEMLKILATQQPTLDQEAPPSQSVPTNNKSPQLSRKDGKVIPDPIPLVRRSPDLLLSTCGHLMHLSCFEIYKRSIVVRAENNIDDRLYPEDIERNEFLCPLCKTLGNCIIPVQQKSFREVVNWNGSRIDSDDSVSRLSFGSSLQNWWESRAPALERLADTPKVPEHDTELATDDSAVTDEEIQDQGILKRIMTKLFSRRGSQQSLIRASSGHAEETKNSIRTIAKVFPYIFPTLEAVTKDFFPGSSYDRLSESVASTISGFERAYRGQTTKASFRADFGRLGFKRIDVLESIGLPTLSMLRLVTLIVVQLKQFQLQRKSDQSSKKAANPLIALLSHEQDSSQPSEAPILQKDAFATFVEYTLMHRVDEELDVADGFSLLKVFWAFENVRFLMAALESIGKGDHWDLNVGSPLLDSNASLDLKKFIFYLLGLVEKDDTALANSITERVNFDMLYAVAKNATLPFLRKSAVYLAVKFNSVPPSGDCGFGYENPAEDAFKTNDITEYHHLLDYLGLPDLISLAREFVEGKSKVLHTLCQNMLSKLPITVLRPDPQSIENIYSRCFSRSILFAYPLRFHLLNLPLKLEPLFEDAFKRVDDYGECNLHMQECGGEIGVYFMIKKFRILLLHGYKGQYKEPPYLDSHGEVDLSMRLQ